MRRSYGGLHIHRHVPFFWLISSRVIRASALAHSTVRQGQGMWDKCLQHQTEKEWQIRRYCLFSENRHQSCDQVKKPTGLVAALGGVRREENQA